MNPFFERAIELAAAVSGNTSPNPNVGAVIVNQGRIVGEGQTQPWGGDHAEVQALKQAGEAASGAGMYVTLEPCCHWGKTPPCTDAIIKAGIREVYAGIADPNPLVNGKGFEALKKAGIEVETGIEAARIQRMLERYIVWITQKRPFFTLKTATTLDGRIAAADRTSRWITGEEARQLVHKLRSVHDAILTGIGTVKADDPLLNVRGISGGRQPVRVILDPLLELSVASSIVKTDTGQRTLVYYDQSIDPGSRADELGKHGITTIPVPGSSSGMLDLHAIKGDLADRMITSVLVECGARLASALVRLDMIDRYEWFVAPALLGSGLSVLGDIGVDTIDQIRRLRVDFTQRVGEDIHLSLVR